MIPCFSSESSAQENVDSLVYLVQRNSENFYKSIHTLQFTGRSKQFVYVGWNAMGMDFIPEYEEYIFEGYWMKPDSLRIIVKALRVAEPDSTPRTKISRGEPLPNPFRFLYDISALGDHKQTFKNKEGKEVRLWPVFPFSVGADSIYNYKYSWEAGLDGKRLLIVNVAPKSPDIPAVLGSFMIDPEAKVVVGSDIVFNEAAEFSRRDMEQNISNKFWRLVFGGVVEDRRIKTKKALLYSYYWLPNLIEEEFFARVIGIKVKINRVIEFESYQINPEIPDTTEVKNKKVSYKIDPESEKELKGDLLYPTRLTKAEEERIRGNIEKMFSSMDLTSELFDLSSVGNEVFNLRLGKKASGYLQLAQSYSDNIIYNRAEGLKLSYGLSVSNLGLNNLIITAKAGYGTGDARLKGEAGLVYYIGEKKKFFLEGGIFNTAGYNESARLITTGKNTFMALFDHSDFRDYYYKKGFVFGFGYHLNDNLAVKFSHTAQKEESAKNRANFSVFRWKKPFRLNPEVLEGNYRSLRGKLIYLMQNTRFELLFEHSDKDFLKSDRTYTLAKLDFNWHIPVNKQHILNILVSAGASKNALPPQHWFDFGGKTLMNYYGNLRGLDYKYFTGDKMINAVIDYEWILVDLFDFEKKGVSDLERLLKFRFWAGAGWSDLTNKSKNLAAGLNVPSRVTDGIYHEFGIGISDRFNMCRIDFVLNSIKENKILFSINVFK